jgi:hypothetical protein
VGVAVGNFADPDFPAPTIGMWEDTRHRRLSLPPDIPPNRLPDLGCGAGDAVEPLGN